jgi:tRNA threonylcarbamoyladenosine biosynthesis protein TsaB
MISSVAHSADHLLLLDTCGASGTLAVAALEPVAVVLGQSTLPGRSTSERLIPGIRSLLGEHWLALGDLAGIAIVHGPGSFTGIRVGLSAAKGLCEALHIPLIAVSRLALLAGKSSAPEVLALLDAGRGEFYCGQYLRGKCLRESLVTRDQASPLAGETTTARMVVCEESAQAALPVGIVDVVSEPTASDALSHAAARFARGQFDDIASIDANYVRRTDVEIFAKQVRPAAARP